MKILSLEIHGFGKLIERRFDLVPGVNLFLGDNEAGKSTLQQAILALLYGFYQGDRATKPEIEIHRRFQPWIKNTPSGKGVVYGGSLRYQLDNGQEYIVHRVFQETDMRTRILDALTGRDCSRQFEIKRHGNVLFAKEHLGMEKALFQSSAFVGQAEVRQLIDPHRLSDAIVSILDTTSPDTSALRAMEILDKKIVEEIGTERARVRRLPKARKDLEDLLREKKSYEKDRQEVEEAAVRKKRLEQEIKKTKSELRRLEVLIISKKLQELESLLNRLTDIEEQLKENGKRLAELKRFSDFPLELRDVFLQKKKELEMLNADRLGLHQEKSKVEEKLKKIRREFQNYKEYQKIASRLKWEEFRDLKTSWQRAKSRVDELVAEQEQRSRELENRGVAYKSLLALDSSEVERIKRSDEDLKTLRTEISRIQQEIAELKAQNPFPRALKGALISLTGLLTLLALGMGVMGKAPWGWPLALGLLLSGGALYWRFRRREKSFQDQLQNHLRELSLHQEKLTNLETEQKATFAKYGATSLSDLQEKRIELLKLGARSDELRKAKEELAKIEGEILQHLRLINIEEVSAGVLEKVDNGFRTYTSMQGSIKDLEESIQGYQKRIKKLEDNIQSIELSLKETLTKAQIFEPIGEESFRIFEEYCNKKRQYDSLKEAITSQRRLKQEILGDRTMGQLEENILELKTKKEALLANYPQARGAESPKPLKELENRYQALNRRREEMEKEVERLEERIATVLSKHRPLAELEEEVALKEAEVRRLEDLREALQLARDIIGEVAEEVHRDFAPQLNKAVAEGLRLITDGKYDQAFVDPKDFAVRLKIPETGEVEEVSVLSLGTREQVYLLLRIGIAKLLSANRESIPLILDDPFVHFDQKRLARMLEFLRRLAHQTQILLFTKDPTIPTWFSSHPSEGISLKIHPL